MTNRDELYARAAAEEDALKGTGREMDGLKGPVPAVVKQNAEAMYSLRFTRSEITELREAAERNEMKLSDLVRRGALEFARRDKSEPYFHARQLQRAIARTSEAIRRTQESFSPETVVEYLEAEEAEKAARDAFDSHCRQLLETSKK
jgi:hypothetical protein